MGLSACFSLAYDPTERLLQQESKYRVDACGDQEDYGSNQDQKSESRTSNHTGHRTCQGIGK